MYKTKKVMITNQLYKYLIIHEDSDSPFYTYSVANKYLMLNKNRRRKRTYAAADYVRNVASFLDYLEKRGQNPEKYLSELTVDDANEYLLYYCNTRNQEGEYPGNKARERKKSDLSRFLENLQDAGISKNLQISYWLDEKTKKRFSSINRDLVIEKTNSKPNKCLLRECPDYFIDSFLKHAQIHKTNCWIAANLSGVTGLRPGEVVNLRHPSSEYGTNIHFDRLDGILVAVQIDIHKEEWEKPLRTDRTPVGSIKRPRLVGILPKYLTSFEKAYRTYMDMTQFYEREKLGPLIVQKRVTKKTGKHMAYNYQNYYQDFKYICKKYVIPELKEMGGEPQIYAEYLEKSKYGPHMFRHAFSCELADEGYAWHIIQKARGDSEKNPDTAVEYVINGGWFDSVIHCNAKLVEQKMKEKGKEKRSAAIPRSL